MNWMLRITGAFVGSLLIQLSAQEPAIHSLKKNITLSSSYLKQTESSEEQVCDRAEKFTIKILSKNKIAEGTVAEGTGILVKKEQGKDEFIYTVLTSDRVVRDNRNYQFQTYDNRLYPATLIARYGQDRSGDDLAILRFNSKNNYKVVTFRSTDPMKPGDLVFAAGFPVLADQSLPRGFKCESGQISWILHQEMQLGYKVGYYVDIEKGMSGGPLLNSKGEVVGINGMLSDTVPIETGKPIHVYKHDGQPVDRSEGRGNLLDNSSWAIPTDKLREPKYGLIDTAIVMLSQVPAQSVLTSREVENRAKAIAVKINRSNILYPGGRWKTEGTGVIIARDGGTYYVLTAKHVVRKKQSYQVETPDGKIYTVSDSNITKLDGVDLAVLRFNSTENNYEVAKIGYFGKQTGSIYVFGWPKGEKTFKLSRMEMVNPRYVDPEVNDYRLLYETKRVEEQTKAGMSGGPILDNNSHLIGIHRGQHHEWQGFVGIPTTIIFNRVPSNIRGLMQLSAAFPGQTPQ